MYAHPGWSSVSNEQASLAFASYLRAKMDDCSSLVYNPHLPSNTLQGPFTFRTMSNQRVNHTAYGSPPTKFLRSLEPFNPQRRYAQPLNMPDASSSIFKDNVMDPEVLYLPTTVDTTPATFAHRPSTFHPYQPPVYPRSFVTTHIQEPMVPKVESSPQLPTPSVLPGLVDSSKYESISHNEWLNAVPNYAIRTPSLVESAGSSPVTTNMHEGDSFPNYAFNIHGHAHNNTQYEPIVFDNPFAPTSALSGDFYSEPPPYGSAGTLRHGLPHCTTTDLHDHSNFHNHVMNSATASPQDIEAHVRSQSEDITDNEAMATSPDSQEEEMFGDERDHFLLEMRKEGLPYKEIKRLGHFKEAESTLRGRVRTLTKEKWERPRKPYWQPHDVALLRQAVRYYTSLPAHKPNRKLPWKKISEWMKDHGSSHQFAPKTCSKKWQVTPGRA